MEENRLQILVSAVNKDPQKLLETMNIQSDAVVVNQLIGEKAPTDIQEGDETLEFRGHKALILNRREKGVGRSRNTAFDHSDHEIIQFGDDDIVYDDGYADRILKEFDAHPEADILLFNVKAQAGRETYWNEDFARVDWHNYGRYAAYAICARREKIVGSGASYSLLFGGGAPYMNGEDSLFLHDCLKAGLSLYRTTVVLGKESANESTWFQGYNEKFFYDRGVLYHFLYGRMAKIFGFRYIFKNRKPYCDELGFFKCLGLLFKGVDHGRSGL